MRPNIPESGRCGACHWFRPDPQPVQDTESPAYEHDLFTQLASGLRALSGGSQPATYGKCLATFTGLDGNTKHYDFGTYSNSNCAATDDNDNSLFLED